MLPRCGSIAGRLIRIAENKNRLMPHAALLPTDSTTVDKIGTLPDDRFQEFLADGTIHPKIKRNDMAVHAAQDSLGRVLAFGGTRVIRPGIATCGRACGPSNFGSQYP